MTILEVVKNSFREYKDNFKSSISLVFLFYALPFVILSLIGYAFGGYAFYTNNIDTFSSGQLWIWYALTIVSWALSLFGYFSLVGGAMEGGEFSVSDALERGKKMFSKGVGISLFMLVAFAIPILLTSLILLFSQAAWVTYTLVLLVFSFIVLIYWSLAFYSLAEKDEGVISALQGSAQMIRGNWWRTLMYGVVFAIISYIILFVNEAIFSLLIYWCDSLFVNSPNVFLIVAIGLSLLQSVIFNLIVVPLSVFYMKNYYQVLK
jgi:hypothetical protein